MQRTFLLVIVAVAVVLVAVVVVSRLGTQTTREDRELQPPAQEPAVTPSITIGDTGEEPQRPTVGVDAVVADAINTRNVSVLKTHMAGTVRYVIASTECCAPMPRSEALAQLIGRLRSGPPFDFSPTNATVQAVRAQATSLADYTIGISANGLDILAYHLNPQLQIDAIYEADARLFGVTGP